MRTTLYRLRYAYWLHRLAAMPWSTALTYPTNDEPDDPREDAETEVSYMEQS